MAKSKYATDQYKKKVRILSEEGNVVKTDKGYYHKTKLFQEGKSLATKDEEKEGVWRTVRGRHIFIEEGKTLEQALGHKPGVENQKKIEDEGLKKTSSAPYLRQAERENYQKKNPPMSAYEKMHQELKRKNRKK